MSDGDANADAATDLDALADTGELARSTDRHADTHTDTRAVLGDRPGPGRSR